MLMMFETATLKQPSSAVARLWLGWAGLGAHQTSGKKCPWPPDYSWPPSCGHCFPNRLRPQGS